MTLDRADPGWHPGNAVGAEYVMAHEFGHAVDNAASRVMGQRTVSPNTPEGWRYNTSPANGGMPAASDVSKYAAASAAAKAAAGDYYSGNETFAEIFAATYSGVTAPIPSSAGMRAYLGAAWPPEGKVNKE